MKATVVNFRGGMRTQRTNQLLLYVDGVDSKGTASKFIGKRAVIRTSSGKEISGRITRVHGNSGILRARFTKGVPGQVVGKQIEIV